MHMFAVVKRSPFVFPLAFALAVTLVVISESAYRQSVEALDRLGVVAEARTEIREMHLGLLDAETGQRGYLLTGSKTYLEPYDKAIGAIDQSLKALDSYYGKDSKPAALVGKLHTVAATKLAELALTIRLHDEGRAEEARQIVLANAGKRDMDAIRTLSAELLDHEDQQVKEGRASVYHTLTLSRVGMAALSAIGLLAMFLYLRQNHAVRHHQQELKRIVQAERDQLEHEVAERTAELSELAHHLQTAREDERSRLARNLHDELGALLTSAKLDAARIKPRLAGVAPEALERLAHLVETLNASIALGRRIIEDLRPSTLSNLGLVATLEILGREFAERSGVEVHCELSAVKLDATAELVVYRLVQEAITNITKYARARHVWITLNAHDGQVEASVRDDGVGFDAAVKRGSAYGLLGMRFRVQAEGGSMSVDSAPGQGTLIRMTLPESVPMPMPMPMPVPVQA